MDFFLFCLFVCLWELGLVFFLDQLDLNLKICSWLIVRLVDGLIGQKEFALFRFY